MKDLAIKGIIVPILTPMNPEDESVNLSEFRNQIERQIAGGVHGIFPFGTNGEGYILSLKEKEELLEAAVDQVKGRVPVRLIHRVGGMLPTSLEVVEKTKKILEEVR